MCGPFKSMQAILRLLEIIFSALALCISLSMGRIVRPWGIWCDFVWVFCIIVPLVLLVMEALKWNILLAAFLPNWADLCCGLTLLCTVMIISASISFGVVFVCLSCISLIFCLVFSLIATGIFLVDSIMQKMKCPKGYLSGLRGVLRTAEAFIACIILTAASDYFALLPWAPRPGGMICSVIVFFVCLLATVVIILLHLLKLLRCLVSFGLNLMELVFNILAALLYLLAVILWCVFGYRHYYYYRTHYLGHPYNCWKCAFADLNAVTVGAIFNLILYIVDLVMSIKAR
ncbi:myeloid-associated differentiation marker-like protein 2 [Scomber scombrus]|nr:myeloid-associated differentiation marker-like protein 2 [Scomber scombrus]